jgi:hypothetical protein
MTIMTVDSEEVCRVCGWNQFMYCEMPPDVLAFCQDCGAPSAKTQEFLDREEPGNWS